MTPRTAEFACKGAGCTGRARFVPVLVVPCSRAGAADLRFASPWRFCSECKRTLRVDDLIPADRWPSFAALYEGRERGKLLRSSARLEWVRG